MARSFHVRVAYGEHLFCLVVACRYAPFALCLQPAIVDLERTTTEEQGAQVALYAELCTAVAQNNCRLARVYASRVGNINGVCAEQLYHQVSAGFVQDGITVICLNSGVVECEGSCVRVEIHLAAHSVNIGEVEIVVARHIYAAYLEAVFFLRHHEC